MIDEEVSDEDRRKGLTMEEWKTTISLMNNLAEMVISLEQRVVNLESQLKNLGNTNNEK